MKPPRSGRPAAGSRLFGTHRATANTSTAPSATLNQNTARQPDTPTSSPPTTGPSASASPDTADHAPRARARSPRSGNSWRITDSVPGSLAAAPTPMTARPAITHAALVATAAISDPAQNTTTPPSISHFRPYRSAS